MSILDIFKGAASVAGTAVQAANPLTPAQQIVTGAAKIIGLFKLDPTTKAQLEQQLTLANLDMEKTALVGQIAELQGQLDTNKAEAASGNVFVAGWRPAVGWVCAMAFGFTFVFAPLATWAAALSGHPVTFPVLDISQLMPVLLGMLGLGVMRTYEKVQGVPEDHPLK
jgi:hypothetical protein